jgi:hypothetical protein
MKCPRAADSYRDVDGKAADIHELHVPARIPDELNPIAPKAAGAMTGARSVPAAPAPTATITFKPTAWRQTKRQLVEFGRLTLRLYAPIQ